MNLFDWEGFSLDRLAAELREDPGGAEGERMIWAFEESLRVARGGADLLPHFLAATICLLARAEETTLILRPVDEDLLVVVIDTADHAGGEHHLFAEDPGACVDNDITGADVITRLVDLADTAVNRLDAVPIQLPCRPRLIPIRPKACRLHPNLLLRVSIPYGLPRLAQMNRPRTRNITGLITPCKFSISDA